MKACEDLPEHKRGVRFHDLRHTYASLGVQSGIALETMSRILGHSTILTTMRYPITTGELLMTRYVRFDGATTWITSAAPYFVDLLTFVLFFTVCMHLSMARWLWLNLVIIGMVSPLINSAYAYQGSFWQHNDVTWFLRGVPPFVVHVYFAATLIGYLVGLSAVFRRSRTACKERTAASSTS